MELSTVVGDHGCTDTLAEHAPAGSRIEVRDERALVGAFRTMVRAVEFEVCEMALTTYLCAKAHGKPLVALPVFPVRRFHHGAVVALSSARAAGPKALEGKPVGVNRGYTVTTGVWARGILEEEHGLDLSAVTWVRSGDEHVSEVSLPANVVDLEPGGDLAEQLVDGRLAAVVGGKIDRPEVVPLLADPEGAAFAAFRDRGLFPINHCVVVRGGLLDERPSLASELFEAFVGAKADYLERLAAGRIAEPTRDDRTYEKVMALTGSDPLPYGIEANRAVLERLVDYAVRQGIVERSLPLERLFAPTTLGLSG